MTAAERTPSEKYLSGVTLLLCLAGFSVSFVAYFPGLMLADSFNMWETAHDFTPRMHHPLLPLLMRLGSYIRPDPSPVLFLQLALMWGGIYFLARTLAPRAGAYSLLIIVPAFIPPMVGYAGLLHKTPLSVACLLFVTGVLGYYLSVGRRPPIVVALALIPILFTGTVIRTWSYAYSLPVIFLYAYTVFGIRYSDIARALSILLVGLIAIGVFGGADTIIRSYLDMEKPFKSSWLFRTELAGIYVYSKIDYAPGFLWSQNHAEAVAVYRKYSGQLWRAAWIYRGATNEQDARVLRDSFLKAVVGSPTAWIRHRVNAVLHSYGIASPMRAWDFPSKKSNKYNFAKSRNFLFKCLKKYMTWSNSKAISQPWFWSILNIILCVWTVRNAIRGKLSQDNIPFVVLVWAAGIMNTIYPLFCLANFQRYLYLVPTGTAFGGVGFLILLAATARATAGGYGLRQGHGGRRAADQTAL